MNRTSSSLDPYDAAVLVCVVASGVFGLLIAMIVRHELVHGLIGLWPVLLALSGVAWITVDTWAPCAVSRRRQIMSLVAFVCVQGLAVAPLVAVGWEVAGPRAVLGAALATGTMFAGLVVFALAKPTTYLEPIDPLVVLVLMALSVLAVGIGLGLPLGLLWATPVVAITGVMALDQTAAVAAYTKRGEGVAGGTRLFICVTVLFADFLYYFVAMAKTERSLWEPFIRLVADVVA